MKVCSQVSLALLVLSLASCSGANFPSGNYGGGSYSSNRYDDRYYRDDYYYNRRERDRIRDERRDLRREREDLERERDRLERERYKETRRPVVSSTARPKPQRCPAGFQRSEQKCSNKERKKGCKDLRLPDGTGCVKR